MREQEKKSQIMAKHWRKNLTGAEAILWSILKGKKLNGHQFRKQHPVGNYITDFACIAQKLIIEVDGATHSTNAELKYDRKRTNFLKSQGWQVFRVGNLDIYNNLDGVFQAISDELPLTSTLPPPSPYMGEENRLSHSLTNSEEEQ